MHIYQPLCVRYSLALEIKLCVCTYIIYIEYIEISDRRLLLLLRYILRARVLYDDVRLFSPLRNYFCIIDAGSYILYIYRGEREMYSVWFRMLGHAANSERLDYYYFHDYYYEYLYYYCCARGPRWKVFFALLAIVDILVTVEKSLFLYIIFINLAVDYLEIKLIFLYKLYYERDAAKLYSRGSCALYLNALSEVLLSKSVDRYYYANKKEQKEKTTFQVDLVSVFVRSLITS